jgi:hypothetical protein
MHDKQTSGKISEFHEAYLQFFSNIKKLVMEKYANRLVDAKIKYYPNRKCNLFNLSVVGQTSNR